MSELHGQLPSESNAFREASDGMTRRQFLARGAITGITLAGVECAGAELYVAHRKGENQKHTQKAFETGIASEWNKIAAFPGLLQIDPSAPVTDGIFGEPVDISKWTNHGLLAAVRPIGVRRSLHINMGNIDRETGKSVYSVIDTIPRHMLAFYLPKSDRLVYLDADASPGLVTPITPESELARLYPDRVPVYDLEIDGREGRDGGVAYPYTQQLNIKLKPGVTPHFDERGVITGPAGDYQAVLMRRLVGHAVCADDVDGFSVMASNFIDGVDPLEIPAP